MPRHALMCAAALTLCATALAAPEINTTDASVTAIQDGQTLWRFNYGPDARKPFFDPLSLPGGPSLSWDSPPDHVWHHGLWFSWKALSGLNYWEEDPVTGKSQGLNSWVKPLITTAPDGTTKAVISLSYGPDPGNTILTEERTLIITPPSVDGAYSIDWLAVFEAKAPEVILERTPIDGEPGGVSWGGYAGLSLRFAAMESPVSCSENGPFITDGVANTDAEAMDYSGVIDGKTCGVAILQHPDSAVHPTPWYVIIQPAGSFYYFSPAVIFRGNRTFKMGETFRLHYRIVIHPGRWDAPRLKQALAELSTTVE